MPEQVLKAFLQQQLATESGVQRLVCGFSGGLDSTVLLHLLVRQAAGFSLPLLAVHVHHGLSPNADAWALHARETGLQWGVDVSVQHVDVAPQASLEAAARAARHQAFARVLRKGDVLLLAQHREDQAETLLFRLLRGSGVAGLGAMQGVSRFAFPAGSVPQWRPLLDVARNALEEYASAQQLRWIEDESNSDQELARNFLRHSIFPLLKTRWPAVSATLSATARRMQEAESLLQEMASAMAEQAIDAQGRLSIPSLLLHQGATALARQRLLLRYWLQQQGFQALDEALLQKVLTEVVAAREDASPVLAWHEGELRRYREHLYVMSPLQPLPDRWQSEWQGDEFMPLPDGRCLQMVIPAGLEQKLPLLQLRYRRGGERLHCRGHERELKILLQEAGVPPWQRDRLPLLFAGDELLAVAGTMLRADSLPPGLEFRLLPELPS